MRVRTLITARWNTTNVHKLFVQRCRGVVCIRNFNTEEGTNRTVVEGLTEPNTRANSCWTWVPVQCTDISSSSSITQWKLSRCCLECRKALTGYSRSSGEEVVTTVCCNNCLILRSVKAHWGINVLLYYCQWLKFKLLFPAASHLKLSGFPRSYSGLTLVHFSIKQYYTENHSKTNISPYSLSSTRTVTVSSGEEKSSNEMMLRYN